ncbi:hypothetical protein GlitD10_1807 [Gloeomargarita lithophora Alchichica-D10]|uniref:Uncharacterized protein n=1 Tax=Gloeomargarita lithophora Alchichica-D10 TaxID=1188229 RepID=A0A1J0ADW9_9CYAN|nr:MgPME-cyclase complex family protein [Gloeomargarita lithophora]APB34133.1 hypothetical protein GlitD10_1807 [Gloeomargarita lithophora Alchichica-D10]
MNYYYVLASEKFLTAVEPLAEVLQERTRYYQEQGKAIDFFLVSRPAFLEAPEFAEIKAQCPQPAAAVITTNPDFATFLKLRLEFVLTGSFTAPSASITDPLATI